MRATNCILIGTPISMSSSMDSRVPPEETVLVRDKTMSMRQGRENSSVLKPRKTNACHSAAAVPLQQARLQRRQTLLVPFQEHGQAGLNTPVSALTSPSKQGQREQTLDYNALTTGRQTCLGCPGHERKRHQLRPRQGPEIPDLQSLSHRKLHLHGGKQYWLR